MSHSEIKTVISLQCVHRNDTGDNGLGIQIGMEMGKSKNDCK